MPDKKYRFFKGEFSWHEKRILTKAILPYLNEVAEPSYNEWFFFKRDGEIVVRQVVWQSGSIHATTARKLAAAIHKYHEQRFEVLRLLAQTRAS